ncbi:Uncharacterised protein [Burkholderia pseudomallei]|nr:Uncharacterised protein [Burkholderia pseudomallei]CAJ2963922.1 Uncharacterised protein [Burkholderia pseudomallei]CAJ3795653.1 Uncharacterised protein [Burkholderia pseudomallei]CAJ4692124.1 Uncharacterised protein [Burkholderia pseudomallei]CAJ5148380.1 Uncharacterised protein [Burkholderia pseudomallei]
MSTRRPSARCAATFQRFCSLGCACAAEVPKFLRSSRRAHRFRRLFRSGERVRARSRGSGECAAVSGDGSDIAAAARGMSTPHRAFVERPCDLTIGARSRAATHRRRATNDARRTTNDERRTTNDERHTAHGTRHTAHGTRHTAHGTRAGSRMHEPSRATPPAITSPARTTSVSPTRACRDRRPMTRRTSPARTAIARNLSPWSASCRRTHPRTTRSVRPD